MRSGSRPVPAYCGRIPRDDIDWIHGLQRFVRQLRDTQKPFVDICFGHQMLAHALGGKVAPAPRGWRVGVHRIELVRTKKWMQPALRVCRLQHLHQDQVHHMPENGVLLGRSDHCPIAMFQVGETMLGIQAHPELPAAYVEAVLRERTGPIGAEWVQAGLGSLRETTDENAVGSWIARFLTEASATSDGAVYMRNDPFEDGAF